jgi:methylated-DNA-[protein]-cysteine S-methyltransferase
MNEQRFFFESFPTPTGTIFLVTDERERLFALDWEDCAERTHRLLRRHYGVERARLEANPCVSHSRLAIEAYFAGQFAAIDALEVAIGGTVFQREVWAALRTIPLGKTVSYGQLATQLGRPKAMRAVGMANAANPVAIVVPCHRVIGANATLTGYAGGLERKRWLLAHEGVILTEPRRASNGLDGTNNRSRRAPRQMPSAGAGIR